MKAFEYDALRSVGACSEDCVANKGRLHDNLHLFGHTVRITPPRDNSVTPDTRSSELIAFLQGYAPWHKVCSFYRPNGGAYMDLKNCKIGMLLEDYLLRRRFTDLLRQNGAVVHCARDEAEMEELLELMDLDIAVVGAPRKDVCWFN